MSDREPLDLVLLDALPHPSNAGAIDPYAWPPQFRVLPFVALAPGDPAPPGTKELDRRARYPLGRLRFVQGVDWLLTVDCDVANLSVGPHATGLFDPLDPLHVGTRALYDRGIPVVVAAGNDGPKDRTLQELARAPWVISVGATDQSGAILESSSRGDPGGIGPTVVSDGTHPDDVAGTSFAAPRVALAAVFARKCVEYLLGTASWIVAGPHRSVGPSVRLPWIGFLDTGWDRERAPYQWGPLARALLESGSHAVDIGVLPEEERWLHRVLRALRYGERDFDLDAGPGSVRRALLEMARRIQGPPHAVGAGFVSIGEARSFFAALTPSRLASVLLPDDEIARQELPPLDDELGPIWDAGKLLLFDDYFATGVEFSVAKVL